MQVAGQHGLSLLGPMATGARVSNAYPTCPPHGDRLPKGRLIRDAVRCSAWNPDERLRPVAEGGAFH